MSKKRWKRRYFKYSDEIRIGAVADYLIGVMKVDDIERKWNVDHSSLCYWIYQMRDHFKTRHPPRSKRESWSGVSRKMKVVAREFLEAA